MAGRGVVLLQENRVQRGRILFVDDDPFYRDMARASLADAGVEVIIAVDGADALAALAGPPVDLIVMDLEMPGLTGFDVLARLRANPAFQHTPVLVITGHDDTGSIERAYHSGATSFLAKPLNWLLFVHHVMFMIRAGEVDTERREAIRQTELMSDLKSRLVSTLVNEFQAPLKSGLSFATLLRREADGPIESALYRTWIADLYAALERLSATHVKMLNFGRVLAEGIALKEEMISFAGFFGDMLAYAEDNAARRGIEIDRLMPPASLHVRADRALLSQAVKAILDNAIRFSERGSRIDVATGFAANGDLTLTVADTSPGLTAAQIEDILGAPEPARAAAAGSLVPQSASLKVCRVLIEAHKGTFVLRSVLGEGLTAVMTLPSSRIKSAGAPSDPFRLAIPTPARSGLERV